MDSRFFRKFSESEFRNSLGELLTARTAERFRAEIRACFGFREATVADADALLVWLRDHAAPEAAGDLDVLVERLETRCREQALKPPAPDRIERIVRAAPACPS